MKSRSVSASFQERLYATNSSSNASVSDADLQVSQESGKMGWFCKFPEGRRKVYPRKLTWNPKIEVWKMIFQFKGVIFQFHVSFRGSNSHWILLKHYPAWVKVMGSFWFRDGKRCCHAVAPGGFRWFFLGLDKRNPKPESNAKWRHFRGLGWQFFSSKHNWCCWWKKNPAPELQERFFTPRKPHNSSSGPSSSSQLPSHSSGPSSSSPQPTRSSGPPSPSSSSRPSQPNKELESVLESNWAVQPPTLLTPRRMAINLFS